MSNNYRVDFQKKTIVITNDFADRASIDTNSNEYKEMRQLLVDYPTYTVKYRKSMVSTKETHKDLTYIHMEEYIKMFELDKDTEALEKFETIKDYYKKASSTPFLKLKSWFLANYPFYKETERRFKETISLFDEVMKKTDNPVKQDESQEQDEAA
jgi:hypothetical protein